MSGYFDLLKSFKGEDFREYYHKCLYIHCRDLLVNMFPGDLDDSVTGILAYCYIDYEQGLSFFPLQYGILEQNRLSTMKFPHQEVVAYLFRLREGQIKVKGYTTEDDKILIYGTIDSTRHKYFDLDEIRYNYRSFRKFITVISNTYYKGENVEKLRSKEYEILDRHRNAYLPDDVAVYLVNDSDEIERVWARLRYAEENGRFLGYLLNEPNRDYGCHKYNLIEFMEVYRNKEFYLVYTGKSAEG